MVNQQTGEVNTATKLKLVEKQLADAYHIDSMKHSWAVIMVSEKGDLMINSDYGNFAYAWRSYGGKEFKHFLTTINIDYLIGKLETSANYLKSGKPYRMPKYIQDAMAEYFNLLKEQLKSEISIPESV